MAKSASILVTVDEAAALLSISRSSLYILVRKGQLRPSKLFSKTVFHRDEIERFVSELVGFEVSELPLENDQ